MPRPIDPVSVPVSVLALASVLTACAGAPRPSPLALPPPPGVDSGGGACAAPDVGADLDERAPLAGAVLDGCFEPGGREDVYRFVVGGTGTRVVTFEIEGAAHNRTFLYLHGPGGDEIYSGNTSVEAGEPNALELIVEGGTTLYLRLYPNVDPIAPRSYRVHTSERVIDEREPDDDPANAAALSPGVPLPGLLLSRLPSHPVPTSKLGEVDVDTYRVEVTRAAALRVDVDEVDPRLRAKIQIHGPGVTQLGPPAPEGTAATSRVAVSPGTYLVQIAHGYDYPAVPTVHQRELAPERRGFTYRVTATIE